MQDSNDKGFALYDVNGVVREDLAPDQDLNEIFGDLDGAPVELEEPKDLRRKTKTSKTFRTWIFPLAHSIRATIPCVSISGRWAWCRYLRGKVRLNLPSESNAGKVPSEKRCPGRAWSFTYCLMPSMPLREINSQSWMSCKRLTRNWA